MTLLRLCGLRNSSAILATLKHFLIDIIIDIITLTMSINLDTEYKLVSLTYKVLTTTEPSYLHNLITV